MRLSRTPRLLLVLGLLAAVLAGCGKDVDRPALSGDAPTSTSVPAPDLTVTGVDYAFQGLPREVLVGTSFTFKNGSQKEAHELVLFKLPDGEQRPLQELLALPQEEAAKVTGPPVAVAVAAKPGSTGEVVVGDSLTLSTPGRYIALCGLPVGSDPVAIAKAVKAKTPPAEDPNAGPPHFTRGMVQEFTVTAPSTSTSAAG